MNEEDFKKLLTEALKPIMERLEHNSDMIDNRLLPSILEIENTNTIYGDMYKLNNDNMVKLERRIEILEDDAGLQATPELTLAKVQ